MRILIDILHPAHVHFFRHFRTAMLERGHDVVVTARAKDVTVELLEELAIPHEVLSRQRSGIGLAGELATRTARLVSRARKDRPTVLTGIMGPSIALVGKLLRIPSVVFYDTEFATRTNRFVFPLASYVCTPDSYSEPVKGNHVTYPGYHELAYLHPDRFEPNHDRLSSFGLRPDEPYSVVRFVSWEASHDTGEIALTPAQKRDTVEKLNKLGRVLISSEAPLPADLAGNTLRGPVSDIHHLLAFAQVIVGESATMASEAAVLGTPAVFIASTGRGYTDDQERRYGLVRYLQPVAFEEALEAAVDLAGKDKQWRKEQRQLLLADKIDVTGWMVDFFQSHSFDRD